MSPQKNFYITTPIYYVNGTPHIGHAYTTIAADVAARWRRLKGEGVFFLTGTDEHGQKVLQKATERGMEPLDHCDDMVVQWQAMWRKLNISNDHFMRTTDAAHHACVQATLQSLWDRGEIYRDTYVGWYSTTVERFWTEKDLVDGKCPETGQPVQKIEETNYFFRMSAYQQRLLDHIEQNPDFIQPEARRNEVLGFLRQPLGDLCISRPKERMAWGIDIPFDTNYVTYVWFDALLNYISVPGWLPGGDDGWRQTWPADYHLIGKDILTTHSVYWTTMLMAMGAPLPKHIYAHGWWVSADGQKMSKSLGNAIDVTLLCDEYGVDPARYFFLREIAFGADGGFSYEGFHARYNADLANDLGNMLHRGLSMTTNWLGGTVPGHGDFTAVEDELLLTARRALTDYSSNLDGLHFKQALDALWELVRAGNKYIDTTQPWALNKQGDFQRLGAVMRMVLEVAHLAGALLLPVMPTRCEELLRRLAVTPAQVAEHVQALLACDGPLLQALETGAVVDVGEPLFPRFRELPPGVQALFDQAAPSTPAAKVANAPKARKPPPPPTPADAIEFADFGKVKLRAGQVLAAQAHPDAEKLLVLTVDVGEAEPRTIVAGIASKFTPEELVGRKVVVVVNLKPAKLRGVWSNGMLLAAGSGDIEDLVSVDASPGAVIR